MLCLSRILLHTDCTHTQGNDHRDSLLLAVNYASIKFAHSQLLLVVSARSLLLTTFPLSDLEPCRQGANQKQLLMSQRKHQEAIDLYLSICAHFSPSALHNRPSSLVLFVVRASDGLTRGDHDVRTGRYS